MKTVQFELNGQPVTVEVMEDEPLLWALRDRLGKTGTVVHEFCGSP